MKQLFFQSPTRIWTYLLLIVNCVVFGLGTSLLNASYKNNLKCYLVNIGTIRIMQQGWIHENHFSKCTVYAGMLLLILLCTRFVAMVSCWTISYWIKQILVGVFLAVKLEYPVNKSFLFTDLSIQMRLDHQYDEWCYEYAFVLQSMHKIANPIE